MSEAERVRQRNVANAEARPVLRPAGNTTPEKPAAKQAYKSKNEASPRISTPLRFPPTSTQPEDCITGDRTAGSEPRAFAKTGASKSSISPGGKSPRYSNLGSTLRKSSNTTVSPYASCSSEGSTGFSCSLSAARNAASLEISAAHRKLRMSGFGRKQNGRIVPDGVPVSPPAQIKKRCAWITSQSDPAYVAFHDEEWGVPVHDDKRLFELLVLAGALAELSWPAILNARETYREVFSGFDPAVVAGFDDKKLTSLRPLNNILLYEGKLHGIVNNAKYILKIVEEFGSLDNYIWGFIGQKPIVNKYRYPRQVPIRTPKAEIISKDLVKRGFRFVGPTVMYSFMQAAGMTNDHLIHCFRCEECIVLTGGQEAGRCNREVQVGGMSEKEKGGLVVKAFDEVSIPIPHQHSHDEA